MAYYATIGFTYFAVGVTVSVALTERGISAGITLTAAILVFSATSELAHIAVTDSGGSAWLGVLSGWLVASRFGLLAASLGARLDGFPGRRAAGIRAMAAIAAFDPNVTVALQQPDAGSLRRIYWRTTAVLLISWWLGTVVGLVLGNVVGEGEAWGLDVIFPAALLAIIGPLLRRLDGLMAALVGAAVSLALLPIAPGGVPILASVVGAALALLIPSSDHETSTEVVA